VSIEAVDKQLGLEPGRAIVLADDCELAGWLAVAASVGPDVRALPPKGHLRDVGPYPGVGTALVRP
jgi:hypothetical protein